MAADQAVWSEVHFSGREDHPNSQKRNHETSEKYPYPKMNECSFA